MARAVKHDATSQIITAGASVAKGALKGAVALIVGGTLVGGLVGFGAAIGLVGLGGAITAGTFGAVIGGIVGTAATVGGLGFSGMVGASGVSVLAGLSALGGALGLMRGAERISEEQEAYVNKTHGIKQRMQEVAQRASIETYNAVEQPLMQKGAQQVIHQMEAAMMAQHQAQEMQRQAEEAQQRTAPPQGQWVNNVPQRGMTTGNFADAIKEQQLAKANSIPTAAV